MKYYVFFLFSLLSLRGTECTFVNGTTDTLAFGEGNNDPAYLLVVVQPRSTVKIDWPLETRTSIDIYVSNYTSGATVDNLLVSSTPLDPGTKVYYQFMNVGGAYNIGYFYPGSGSAGGVTWGTAIEYFMYGFGFVSLLNVTMMTIRMLSKAAGGSVSMGDL